MSGANPSLEGEKLPKGISPNEAPFPSRGFFI